jgi:hypothetical protein
VSLPASGAEETAVGTLPSTPDSSEGRPPVVADERLALTMGQYTGLPLPLANCHAILPVTMEA